MAHRLCFAMQIGGNVDSLELAIAADEFRERDFGEVVILGSDPEHGNGLRIPLPQTARELHCRKCFVNCVEWTSEQPGLLA